MDTTKGKSQEEINAFNEKYPMPEHPVIRTHPDTKKKVIYVNRAFTQYIKGWKEEQVRARADKVVKDEKTAESLKPYYNQFCKRPCFHDEYLDTFNRPNVELVDTDGKGLEENSENGIVFNGKEYEVDCIIFATGFEVGTEYSRRAGYQIHGVEGITVTQKWGNGLSTFHGILLVWKV